MGTGAKPNNIAKRQHFIARFYLRNFAEPLFSDNLCFYSMQKRRWEKRTPDGVGWYPHLCSLIEMDGTRTDSFDQYLKLHVEDPAAPALKKLATGESLNSIERHDVAMFIALTAARSPKLMNDVRTAHLNELSTADRAELDGLVKLWCEWTKKPYNDKAYAEFLKPSSFGAIWSWSRSLQRRLVQWQWHLIQTTRDLPFVTSDWPVFAQSDQAQNVRLVTFPVSSEVALVIVDGGQFKECSGGFSDVRAMNRGTMDRAVEFVVACMESFPSDDYLAADGECR